MGDRLVTCAVIAQSFMLVMTMPLGVYLRRHAVHPFLSSSGAHQFDRVRAAQRYIRRLCMGFTAVMMVLAFAAGGLFVRLFTQDEEVARLSVWAIRVCMLAVAIPLGAQYAIVDRFTALGQVKLSFLLSFFRKACAFRGLRCLFSLRFSAQKRRSLPNRSATSSDLLASDDHLQNGPSTACSATDMRQYKEEPWRFPLFFQKN